MPDVHALDGRVGHTAAQSEDPAAAFEAVFIGEMFKAMRATVHEVDGSFGRSVCTSMLDEQLAQTIAESGGLGLTAALRDTWG
jgi:Rod binding domain-containing protein